MILQVLGYKGKHTELGNFRSFFAFLPPLKTQKWKFWKMSSLYTCEPKITITWCMVPDLGIFLPFYYPLPYPHPTLIPKIKFLIKNDKKCLEILSFYTYMCTIMKIIWYMVPEIKGATDRNFCYFMTFFLPFQTTDILKNQNFTIEKKRLEILSFYLCVTKMTVTWWMVPEISSTTDIIFCRFESFYALLPKKSKFRKKRKKCLEILLFYTSVT